MTTTIVIAGLVLAGCGGDSPELAVIDPEVATSTETATAEPTATPVPPVDPTGSSDDGDDPDATPTATDDSEPTPETEPTAAPGELRPTPTPAPVSGEPAFTSASKLTTVGLDEVFFGDPVRDAAEKASTTWIGLPAAGAEPQCYTVQPAGGPTGVVFTVVDGRIERVDIATAVITTRSGAGVGSTEAELDQLFGSQLEITPVTGGNEIAFVPVSEADQAFRIVWTTDGTTVTHMRAGRLPQVSPPSPCST